MRGAAALVLALSAAPALAETAVATPTFPETMRAERMLYGCRPLGDVWVAMVRTDTAAALVLSPEGRIAVLVPETETDSLVVLAEPADDLFLRGRYVWRERALPDEAGPGSADGPAMPVQILWRDATGETEVARCRFLLSR